MFTLSKAMTAAICLAAFNLEAVSVRATVFGCSKDKGHYSCDKPAFTTALKDARTVAVESQPFNKISTNALQSLARELGKNVQPESAQLIFDFEPTNSDDTVYYVPDDRELATLRVYAAASNGKRGQLIWVESVVGQPDQPWAMIVHSAIQQFKADLK